MAWPNLQKVSADHEHTIQIIRRLPYALLATLNLTQANRHVTTNQHATHLTNKSNEHNRLRTALLRPICEHKLNHLRPSRATGGTIITGCSRSYLLWMLWTSCQRGKSQSNRSKLHPKQGRPTFSNPLFLIKFSFFVFIVPSSFIYLLLFIDFDHGDTIIWINNHKVAALCTVYSN